MRKRSTLASRILSAFVTFTMVSSLVPAQALAEVAGQGGLLRARTGRGTSLRSATW